MQLRHHPQMIGRWLPKQLFDGGSAVGVDRVQMLSELPDTAVLHSVGNCPPLSPWTGAQGLVLNTDLGTAIILTADSLVREHLFHMLQASLGMALRNIGDFVTDW